MWFLLDGLLLKEISNKAKMMLLLLLLQANVRKMEKRKVRRKAVIGQRREVSLGLKLKLRRNLL
jgi:hypothetical protein